MKNDRTRINSIYLRGVKEYMVSELVGRFMDKSAAEMKGKMNCLKSFTFLAILLLLLSKKVAVVTNYVLSCWNENQRQLVKNIIEVVGSCLVWLIGLSFVIWIIAIIARKIADMFFDADSKNNYLIRLRMGSEYKMLDTAEDMFLLTLVYAGLFNENLLVQIGMNDIGIIIICFLILIEVVSSTIFGILNRFFVIWGNKN